MNTNAVYKNILKFGIKTETISLSQFQDLLESSSRSNPIRVQWETLAGNTDYYWMWWVPGPIGTTVQGEEMTKTKAREGMYNIQTTLTNESGRKVWRTLDLQTVSKARFENTLYIVN
jgi:hypothetical protein